LRISKLAAVAIPRLSAESYASILAAPFFPTSLFDAGLSTRPSSSA